MAEESSTAMVVEDTFVLEYPNIEEQHKKKGTILRVTYPDGRIIEDRTVLNTLADVICYAGIDVVHDLGIMVNGTNLLSDSVPDLYNNSKQHIFGDYVLMTCSNTETKYRQIKQISEVEKTAEAVTAKTAMLLQF